MMEWVPIVFVVFKLGVFGTGMFFAIKWHYDREQEEKAKRLRRQQGAGAAGPAGPAPD